MRGMEANNTQERSIRKNSVSTGEFNDSGAFGR